MQQEWIYSYLDYRKLKRAMKIALNNITRPHLDLSKSVY